MIINANALSIPLADKCVHTVVTSPPYYGLRDYGTARWEGGDSECEHTISMPTKWNDPKRGYDVLRPEVANRGGDATHCHLCGAIRIDEQIGLEQTPDEYVANLVQVFRECKRILRDDGTLWLNIGDSYASMKSRYNQKAQNLNGGKAQDNEFQGNKTDLYHHPELGIKDKDLIGIPWMLAFALRADGWYLRSDIIWAKKNCMPESVKDRPTKSHEYIFLLSKSAKYYYDNEAVKTPTQGPEHDKRARVLRKRFPTDMVNGIRATGYYPTANLRDVWHVATKPYKGAHYATFPPDLITPCILAGAPEGGIVFDPFVGSGTTVATAIQLGRRGVGLDLSFKYLNENAKARIDDVRLPLLEDAWK